MMSKWLAWRLLKFLGVAAWTAGIGGAVFSRDQRRRLWSVHVLATAGLLVCWIAGYGMAKISGAGLGDAWVATSLLASFLCIHEACAVAQRPRVLPWNVGALVATFLCAVGAMVVRAPGPGRTFAAFGLPLVAGVLALAWQRRHGNAHDYSPQHVPAATRRWVVWIGRLEGLSLLALFGVYMPLKYGAGVVLDGGQGWFGWVHGAMTMLWLQALWSGWRRLGWSGKLTAMGLVASLLPAGTFVFERYVPRVDQPSDHAP